MQDNGPNPYVVDIEKVTVENEAFRRALWTGENMQLTLMTIKPGEDIGLEVHNEHDQFLRVEKGSGTVQMGPSEDNLDFVEKVADDFAVFVPAGVWHNITNDSDEDLKLYSIYAPAEHPHGTVHADKAEAEAAEHHH